MGNTRKEKYLLSYAHALGLRKKHGYKETDPICAVDFAEKCGVPVQFVDSTNMEGLYSGSPVPHIMLGAYRPAGRQSFTCAHELGHHFLGHGFRVDELDYNPRINQEEFSADAFAASLLMPKGAVQSAFVKRSINVQTASALDFFQVACFLGVSYAALIQQTWLTLRLLEPAHARQLLRVQPKDVKKLLFGKEVNADLVMADELWTSRPIDLHVDDVLVLPKGVLNKGNVLQSQPLNENCSCFRALHQGMCQVETDGWIQFVHVSRRNYVGLAAYRHLEDFDDDGSY